MFGIIHVPNPEILASVHSGMVTGGSHQSWLARFAIDFEQPSSEPIFRALTRSAGVAQFQVLGKEGLPRPSPACSHQLMGVWLPREDPAGVQMLVVVAWVLLLASVVCCPLVFVEDWQLSFVVVGLSLLGSTVLVYAKHRLRRPTRRLEVDGDGIRLMPENETYQYAELGPLTIAQWSYIRQSKHGPSRVHCAAVKSKVLDIELYRVSERSECEDWIKRLEAAKTGVDQVPPTAMDRAIEKPSSAAIAIAFTATLITLIGLALNYGLEEPSIGASVGTGLVAMAAIAVWSTLSQRTMAVAVGLSGGLILAARPLIHPIVVEHGLLGPYAERHLSFYAGATLVLVHALWVFATRPRSGA